MGRESEVKKTIFLSFQPPLLEGIHNLFYIVQLCVDTGYIGLYNYVRNIQLITN